MVEIVAVTVANHGLLDRLDPDVFDEPIVRHRLTRYLAEPGHFMLVAVEDDEVIGMCTSMIHRHADKPDDLYIDEVGVADKALRRGIGTQLMEAMLELGRQHGCESAWVATEADNRPAQALYRSLDPTETERCVYYLYDLDD